MAKRRLIHNSNVERKKDGKESEEVCQEDKEARQKDKESSQETREKSKEGCKEEQEIKPSRHRKRPLEPRALGDGRWGNDTHEPRKLNSFMPKAKSVWKF